MWQMWQMTFSWKYLIYTCLHVEQGIFTFPHYAHSSHWYFTLSHFSHYFAAMIAFVKGNFVLKTPALVHVDVNGVGYEVQISLNTYSSIQALQQGMLHTYLHIREDAQVLYGFLTWRKKNCLSSWLRLMASALQLHGWCFHRWNRMK